LVIPADFYGARGGVDPKATGRPSYHSSCLLKLYIYGYLNRVQSSRRPEREAGRNVEVMWLTRRLAPDHKTIADFRKNNGRAIREVCSRFVMLCRAMGLLTQASVAIVEVSHPKVPYIHENRYHVTVFDHDSDRGSVIGVELRFGFMEESNVERYLEDMAGHKEIDLPTHPQQWIVHVSHENLLPAKRINLFKRLRFYLFLFLRLVSRPAYYAYGLGNEVQLSAEIMPVRVR